MIFTYFIVLYIKCKESRRIRAIKVKITIYTQAPGLTARRLYYGQYARKITSLTNVDGSLILS